MNNLVNNISEMRKAIFGVEVITNTEPSMRKTANPYLGRVRKITKYINAVLGASYEEAVNNRVEKVSGKRNFKASAPSGKKWYNPFFYTAIKDDNRFYLRIGMRKNSSKEYYYLVDGHIATPQQFEEIESFLTSKSETSQKQADFGLTDENQYHFTAPLLDNVTRIAIGDKVVFERTTLTAAA